MVNFECQTDSWCKLSKLKGTSYYVSFWSAFRDALGICPLVGLSKSNVNKPSMCYLSHNRSRKYYLKRKWLARGEHYVALSPENVGNRLFCRCNSLLYIWNTVIKNVFSDTLLLSINITPPLVVGDFEALAFACISFIWTHSAHFLWWFPSTFSPLFFFFYFHPCCWVVRL